MNKRQQIVLSAAAVLLAGLGPILAAAAPPHRHLHHRPFVRSTVVFAPFYAFPYYYAPPGYYRPAPPLTFIEQGPPAPQTIVPPQLFSGALWYCPSVGVYYPNVPQCPVDWQRVTPPPPPPPD